MDGNSSSGRTIAIIPAYNEPQEKLHACVRSLLAQTVKLDKIIVMDEPTSSLSAAETAELFRLIRELKSRGLTLIYVSHRMEEIFRLCDAVTVMRDGQHVTTMPLVQTNEQELVKLMIGRSWQKKNPEKPR